MARRPHAGAMLLAALVACGCTNEFDTFLPRDGDAGASVSGGDTSCAPLDGGGCYATARACGQACSATRTTCEAACTTPQCRRDCRAAETSCKSPCVQACVSCTTGAGCATQQQCAADVG